MARNIIGQDRRGMPGPAGIVNYSAVLVEQDGVASAYRAATLEAQWVADRGEGLTLEAAKEYFPFIVRELADRGLRYVKGEA